MRKRSKYRPKPVLVNPLGYVIESLTPVTQHENFLLDLKIKNSESMVSLMQGRAVKADMDILIAMSNVTEALHQMGFGAEYQDVCVGGRMAILTIIDRARQHGRFTPTGPEIQTLNLLMELHDAQMDIVTIRDIEKALALAKHKIAHSKDTIKLPPIPETLK
jgi:hypothetical protein